MITVEELNAIHNKLETELGRQGAYIDGLYYCPHHPDKGFKGEVEALKVECDCRKPKPGLILRASDDFNIDIGQSWMIGDDGRDIGCGKNAGCRTALISSTEELGQDITAMNLLAAVEEILVR